MRLVPLTRFTSQALHDLFDETDGAMGNESQMGLLWSPTDYLQHDGFSCLTWLCGFRRRDVGWIYFLCSRRELRNRRGLLCFQEICRPRYRRTLGVKS